MKYLLLVVLFLSGCVTGERMGSISPGMSQAQVRKVLGAPDGYSQAGEFISLKYKNRLISGWSWDRVDYGFIFKNDSLVEYGAGEVRQDQSHGANMLVLVPLR